jgi:hypothetical protein
MKRLFYLLLLPLLVSLFACSNEPEAPPVATGPVQQTNPALIADSLIYLSCTDVTQPDDQSTHYEVYAQILENRAMISDVENCSRIDRAIYADYDIPETALDAIGDENLVIYLVRTANGRIIARQGTNDGSGTLAYRAIATFSEEEMSANPEINPAALVGTYTGGMEGSDVSYLLFVGLSNRVLTAQLFRVPGPVPAPENLMAAMRRSEPELLRDFVVDITTLAFDSSTGTGLFMPQDNGGMKVRFDAIMTPDREPLVLTRVNQTEIN